MSAGSPDLLAWEPGRGVLDDYDTFWSPTTDAPRVYHIAAGLAVLAATVENRVHLPFGGERIYPNLWILILGPSSFFRKSTCVSKARRTIKRIYVNEDGSAAASSPLLPDEFCSCQTSSPAKRS